MLTSPPSSHDDIEQPKLGTADGGRVEVEGGGRDAGSSEHAKWAHEEGNMIWVEVWGEAIKETDRRDADHHGTTLQWT